MLVLSVWLAPATRAELVSQDYLVPGDGLLTLDSQTGLRWLDVSATQGLSAKQVLSGAGGWFPSFRYATYTELSVLFEHAGLPNLAGPNGSLIALTEEQRAALYPLALNFNTLLNTASPCCTNGLYVWGDNSISLLGVSAVISNPRVPNSRLVGGSYLHQYLSPLIGKSGTPETNYDSDWSNSQTGSMLILAVPEPETWALLLAGLGLLGFMARRRATPLRGA